MSTTNKRPVKRRPQSTAIPLYRDLSLYEASMDESPMQRLRRIMREHEQGVSYQPARPIRVPNPAWQEVDPDDQAEHDEEYVPKLAPVKTPIVPEVAARTEAAPGPDNPIRDVPRLLIADLPSKPTFYMGVEFEGMVRQDAFRLFRDHLCDLGHDDEGQCLVQFGTDGSIRNIPAGYQGVEVRTQVVRSRLGIKLFEEVLCFLYLASQTGDWLTNESCGLHINISEEGVWERGKEVDYYAHVVSLFDEVGVLARFGRTGNRYCKVFPGLTDDRSFDACRHQFRLLQRRERAAADRGADKWSVSEGKYLAVSLRHSPEHDGYDGQDVQHQRVEFRALGGTDYHLRFDDLEEAVNHMISCVRMAYREVMS